MQSVAARGSAQRFPNLVRRRNDLRKVCSAEPRGPARAADVPVAVPGPSAPQALRHCGTPGATAAEVSIWRARESYLFAKNILESFVLNRFG